MFQMLKNYLLKVNKRPQSVYFFLFTWRLCCTRLCVFSLLSIYRIDQMSNLCDSLNLLSADYLSLGILCTKTHKSSNSAWATITI